jgi:proton-coupled amino acid transporter
MELGICAVYFEFISINLIAAGFGSAYTALVFINFPIIVSLSWIRNMRVLAMLLILANIFMAVSLAGVLGFTMSELGEHGVVQGLPPATLGGLPLFFGTVIYSLEGCGAVLPIENNMQDSSQFPRVLKFGFITYVFFYLLIGLCCYIAYPDIDGGSITAVLQGIYTEGTSKVGVTIVNVAAAAAVLLTYPMQFYAAAEVFEDHFEIGTVQTLEREQNSDLFGFDEFDARRNEVRVIINVMGMQLTVMDLQRMALRTFLVLFTAAFAVVVPDLAFVVALFGSVFGSAVALIMPPILALGSGYEPQNSFIYYAILVTSVVASIAGTIVAVENLVKYG